MKNFEHNGKNESVFSLKDDKTNYEVAGPTVDNITLVRFAKDGQEFEKFLVGQSLEGQPSIVKGYLSDKTFPSHTVLAYGKTCATVLTSPETCNFFDMENQEYIPTQMLTMTEVNEENLNYIQNAMFGACSGPNELSNFIAENGAPKTEEEKMFLLSLLNNVNQIVADKTFRKVRNQIFGGQTPKAKKPEETFFYDKEQG